MKKVIIVIFCIMVVFVCGCDVIETAGTAGTSTPANTPTATPNPTPTPTPVPTPTPTPDPTPTPVPEPTRITVMAVGDLLCLNAQLSAARHGGSYDFDYVYDGVRETIGSADLAIANLETLVAEGYDYTGPVPMTTVIETDEEGNTVEKTIQSGSTLINAPASFLDAALDCGFDVLTNANNHMFDHGTDGIVKTLAELDARGVPHTGAYAAEEDRVPLVVDVEGIRIAIFAYTDVLNRSPGSGSAFMIDRYSEDLVAADISAASEAGADYTIVFIHWGTENTHSENGTQRRIAEDIANAGADIILGSHPHATQPMELIATERGENVPVVYSMGNFISSMSRTMNKDSVIMRLVLEKEYEAGITSLTGFSYIPTLCTSTNGGSFAALTADLASIDTSDSPSQLEKSRNRTIDVLGDLVATPE